MKFEQTKDIIARAISFHQIIGVYYENCMKNTDNPRLKMLLQYLMDHEKKLLNGLSEYGIKAPSNILHTWFQFSTCSEKFGQLKKRLSHINPSIDEIRELTIDLYECISTQFELMAENADVDEVKQVFQNIANKEKKEQKKLVRNFQLLDDL